MEEHGIGQEQHGKYRYADGAAAFNRRFPCAGVAAKNGKRSKKYQ